MASSAFCVCTAELRLFLYAQFCSNKQETQATWPGSLAMQTPYFAVAAAGWLVDELAALSISGSFRALRASFACGPSGS